MSFSEEQGYIANTVEGLMALVREGVNEQFGTSYDAETFLGTNFYKYFYALIQRLQENEVKTSEIVLKLQQYFAVTNEVITRPNTTHPGIRSIFEEAGYLISTKAPVEADAGKLFVCVDHDAGDPAEGTVTITDYAALVSGTPDVVTVEGVAFTAQAGAATPGDATFQAASSNDATATSLATQIAAHATTGAILDAAADAAVVTITAKQYGTPGNEITLSYTDNDTNVGATVSGATLSGGDPDFDAVREEICELIKDSVPAGIVTQGDQVQSITLSNDQSFDFKFNLPTRITTLLRLTITVSDNNQYAILSDSDVAELLLENLTARYRLGLDFEPQRYFSILDAPWAASVLLEWSINDGADYYSTVNDLEYNELMEVALADIEVVTA